MTRRRRTARAAADFGKGVAQWFDWWSLAQESAEVIALRCGVIAAGGPRATAESSRMVSEKLDALATATTHLATGDWGSDPAQQSRAALRFTRAKVRANRRRLSI